MEAETAHFLAKNDKFYEKYAFAASLFSEKNNLLNINVRNMLELVAIHFITNFQEY